MHAGAFAGAFLPACVDVAPVLACAGVRACLSSASALHLFDWLWVLGTYTTGENVNSRAKVHTLLLVCLCVF